MKILVLSDSHGNVNKMKDLFRQDDYRAVIFLGDVIRDADELARITGAAPVYRVKGNCDFGEFNTHDELLIELGGKRIFMAHGHRYGVKGGIGSFEAAARKSGADIALYGHTHIQYHDTKDGLHILNPGALMNGKYAVLTIEGSISIELKGM